MALKWELCVLGVGARLWAQLKVEHPKLVNPAEARCCSDVPNHAVS